MLDSFPTRQQTNNPIMMSLLASSRVLVILGLVTTAASSSSSFTVGRGAGLFGVSVPRHHVVPRGGAFFGGKNNDKTYV